MTKSHRILDYIKLLQEMKHMVQIELTLISLDPGDCRLVEPFAQSVKLRLKTIEKLDKAGIFVRVMAMPVIAQTNETDDDVRVNLAELRDTVFIHGAQAFKNKGLNYFDEDHLVTGDVIRIKGQENAVFDDFIVKSGELIPDQNGNPQTVSVLMPPIKQWGQSWRDWTVDWETMLVVRDGRVVCWGYDINDINWKYIR